MQIGINLPRLTAQDAAGEDVTAELRPLHLGGTPFRCLAGARSMLDPSASGFSRTVVARALFQTVTLPREPEAIAFTAPGNASLFELETDNGMLLPFEGMGADTVWRFELPKRPTRSTFGP